MGVLTRRRGVMLLQSLMMALLLSMMAVMVMRWVLGRHMLALRAYKSGMSTARSEGYYTDRFNTWRFNWESFPSSGSTVINGQTIAYERSMVGESGTAGTPAVPYRGGSPAIPGQPPREAIRGHGVIPAVGDTPHQDPRPAYCAPYDPGCAGLPDGVCQETPGCNYDPGQPHIDACHRPPCHRPPVAPCPECIPPVEGDTGCNDDGCDWPEQQYSPPICYGGSGDSEGSGPCPGDMVPARVYQPFIPGHGEIPAQPDVPYFPGTPTIPGVPGQAYQPPVPGTSGTWKNKVVLDSDEDEFSNE